MDVAAVHVVSWRHDNCKKSGAGHVIVIGAADMKSPIAALATADRDLPED